MELQLADVEPGGYWDERFWALPNKEEIEKRFRKTVRCKKFILSELSIRFCKDGKWRSIDKAQCIRTLVEVANLTQMTEADLLEWQKLFRVRNQKKSARNKFVLRSKAKRRKFTTVEPSIFEKSRNVRPKPLPRNAKFDQFDWLDKVQSPRIDNPDARDELKKKGSTWQSGGE